MDAEDILPGEKWDNRIQAAVESADFVMFFISRISSQKRGYIQKELRAIFRLCEEKLDDDIYLIPVRIDDCDIPRSLQQYQWMTFGGVCSYGWHRLYEAIVKGWRRKKKG